MDRKACQCNNLEWECWIQLNDHQRPNSAKLWWATECHECGKITWIPYSHALPVGTVPENVFKKGIEEFKRHLEVA